MDPFEAVGSVLKITDVGILIIILFGYLLLRYFKNKKFDRLHESEKLIFAIAIGITLYLIGMPIIQVLLRYNNLMYNYNLSLDYLNNIARLIFIIISIVLSTILLTKEIGDLFDLKKLIRLREQLKLLLYFFSLVAIVSISVWITTYMTIFEVMSSEITSLTILILFFELKDV